MSIKLPASAQGAFNGNMQSGSKVELPFYTPAFWIMNGKASMKQIGGVHFFGGWACESSKVEAAKEHWQDLIVPPLGLTSTEFVADSGQSMNVFAARSLYVAVIGVRQFSIAKVNGEDRRVPPFTPGARPGVQILAVLGYRDADKNLRPWAPILLSAKGYQVNHLSKAVNAWGSALKPVLKKMGLDGAHPGLFWSAIGTFGEERKQELVGKGTDKSTITPVSVYIPTNEISEETVSKLYVGEDVADWMAELSGKAKDWLHAFDVPANAAPVQPVAAEPSIPEEPPFADESIHF